MAEETLYTLKVPDDFPICIMCLDSIEDVFINEGILNAPIIEKIFTKGYRKIKKVFPEIDFDKVEDFYKLKDIELDYDMCQAMMHAIIGVFQYLNNDCIRIIDKEKQPEAAAEQEACIELFNKIKDEAADLLTKLTKAIHYNESGVRTLERIFERKIAEMPLYYFGEKENSSIKINEHNSISFNLIFDLLDHILLYHDKYKFAEMFFNCQFIHLDDYNGFKKDFNKLEIGKETLFDTHDKIVLHLLLNIIVRYFVSNASDTFEEFINTFYQKEEKKKSVKEYRKDIITFCKITIEDIEKEMLGNNNFNREIKRIETWPIDID